MRIIDADALREEWLYENGMFEPNDVLGSIDDQPTIDAVPIVHGEWEKARPKGIVSYADGYAECSNCHDTIWCGWKMNYCPNCGAKMKGEDDAEK